MENAPSLLLDTTPEIAYANLKARKQPALFSTFPEQELLPSKGCMTTSVFRSVCDLGRKMLPDAGTVPLIVTNNRDVEALVILVTFYVQVEQLEVHVRLGMHNTIDIGALCRAIKLYGPRVENMSLTVPHTVPLADFRALWLASQSVMSLRCSVDGTVPVSSATRPVQPSSHGAAKPTPVPVSSATRPVQSSSYETGWISRLPPISDVLPALMPSSPRHPRNEHLREAVTCVFRSRWPSEQEVRSGDVDLDYTQALARMFTFGQQTRGIFVRSKWVLGEVLKLLKTSPPAIKPNIVVRCCNGETLRSFHNVLADLQPHCATLWVIMADTSASDSTLADLMLCCESCQHGPLDDGQCMLFLTGIMLSGCSRLTDEAMPMLANVERVNVDFCGQLTPRGIAHLRHCTDVSAKCTMVSDEDLRLFADATSLDISSCPVTPDGLTVLRNVRAVKADHLFAAEVSDHTNICG